MSLPARYCQKTRLLLRGVLAIGRRDYAAATELASRALELLDEDQARWLIIAAWCLAEAQERTRPISEAIHSLREARKVGRALGNQVFAAVIDSSLAADPNHHGRRQAAIAVCEEACERYRDDAGRPSPLLGLILSRLGLLCYEADELDLAHRYVERGLALGEQLPVRSPLAFALGVSALILHARGEPAAALAALRRASQSAAPDDLADVSWLPAWVASLCLRQGDLAPARRWAETAGLSPDDELEFLRVGGHLAYARLLLAEARLDDARRWLARLEGFTRERELEVLALIAAGHSNQEIANRLVIAPGTVKRHINHIYGKLDVASRTQAIARARALRLL